MRICLMSIFLDFRRRLGPIVLPPPFSPPFSLLSGLQKKNVHEARPVPDRCAGAHLVGVGRFLVFLR